MPFNMVGFCEATPGTGTNPLAVAVNEQLYQTHLDDLMVTQEAPFILGVHAMAVSTGRSAILRQPKMVDYDIIKVMLSSMSSPTCGFSPYMARPLPLRVDKLNALIDNDDNDEAALIGIMLGSGKITQAMKDNVNPTHTILGYSATTLTTLTWGHCPITWVETLDAGVFEVVGMRCGTYISAAWTGGIARISIPGSQSWKPGVPCTRLIDQDQEYQNARWEGMYAEWPLMGVRFDTQHMPNIECLSVAAITHELVELTLQKVG